MDLGRLLSSAPRIQGTNDISARNVYDSTLEGNKQPLTSKTMDDFENDRQDPYPTPGSAAATPAASSSFLDKGKPVATPGSFGVATPVSMLEGETVSGVQHGTGESWRSDGSSKISFEQENHLQIPRERSRHLVGASSARFVEPEIVNRRFDEFLRAQYSSSGFYTQTIPLSTPEIGHDLNWSSHQQVAFRAPQDAYSHSFRLPHPQNRRNKPILLYPRSNSEVPDEHADAFGGIIDKLQENINRFAPSCDMEIHYENWMCGTSKHDVHPSIVVICKKDNLAEVESVLTLPHIRGLCNIVTPLPKAGSMINLPSFLQPNPKPRGIWFNMYFCPRDTSPAFKVWADVAQVDTDASIILDQNPFGFPWSGSRIVIGKDTISTLACFLRIGAEIFGLTTAHACIGLPNSRLLIHGDQISSDLMDTDYSKWDKPSTKTANQIPCCILLPFTAQQSTTMPDLDWALLRVPQQYLPSALHSSMKLSEKVPPNTGGIASFARPKISREVIIFCSHDSRTKLGTLLPGITYQTVSHKSCKVSLWSAAPHPGHEILPGDSGSLVVDSDTYTAYGYVVSVNTFGFAQIIPLSAAINQLQSTFGLADIQLELWSPFSNSELRMQQPVNHSLRFLDKCYSTHDSSVKSEDQSIKLEDQVVKFEDQSGSDTEVSSVFDEERSQTSYDKYRRSNTRSQLSYDKYQESGKRSHTPNGKNQKLVESDQSLCEDILPVVADSYVQIIEEFRNSQGFLPLHLLLGNGGPSVLPFFTSDQSYMASLLGTQSQDTEPH